MISEKDKKEIEKWLSEWNLPKTDQKIEDLKINPNFLRNITILRKKWANFINKHKAFIDKILKLTIKNQNKSHLNKTKHYKLSKKDLNKLSLIGKQHQWLFKNAEFNKDIFACAKKYKLYPIKNWQYPLTFFTVTNNFDPPNYWPSLELQAYSSMQEMIQLPRNMNFNLQIKDNEETNESELWIHLYENTTLQELKKHWKVINNYQDKLKRIKNTGKRYYPRKNMKKEKQSIELDKTNLSDWEKQEKIYGEIKSSDFGPEEKKRKTRLKVMRYRYKKRFAE